MALFETWLKPWTDICVRKKVTPTGYTTKHTPRTTRVFRTFELIECTLEICKSCRPSHCCCAPPASIIQKRSNYYISALFRNEGHFIDKHTQQHGLFIVIGDQNVHLDDEMIKTQDDSQFLSSRRVWWCTCMDLPTGRDIHWTCFWLAARTNTSFAMLRSRTKDSWATLSLASPPVLLKIRRRQSIENCAQ